MSSNTADRGALGPLPPEESLREQVLGVIRTALLTGRIRQDEAYSAAALAKRFGVSTSPVREALLTLTNQGIMEAVRNRGFRVVPCDAEELEEVHELRTLLEAPGMRRVAESRDPAAIERFRELLDRNERAARLGEVHAFLDTDQEFHLGLLALAGNRRLVDMVDSLRLRARLCGGDGSAVAEQLEAAAAEHREILAAVTEGDGLLAERLMLRHLERARQVLLSGAPER